MQEDPLQFDGGINFYPYVANHPVNYGDPAGLFIFPLPIVTGAFGALGAAGWKYSCPNINNYVNNRPLSALS
jgi:hypothetical protein